MLLRARQWIIPNYALPPNANATEILRVVVRVNMSLDLLDQLITDIVQVTEMLVERDEVDLSVLKEQTERRRNVQEKDKEHGSKRQRGDKAEGGEKKRMEEGIHRSVC